MYSKRAVDATRCQDRSSAFESGSRLRPVNLPFTANAGTTEDMAKGKLTPEKSKIERQRPIAYSRRQKGSGGGEEEKPSDPAKAAAEESPVESKSEAPTSIDAKFDTATDPHAGDAATVEPPPPKGEPWPDATPPPMKPVEPARSLATGAPPEMPETFMPGPRDIPGGNPNDPATAPGRVPSGDSRSLRKDNEFALIYRVQTAVISRFGVVGTRGQWRVVDYPTSSSASSAYAKEVSRFVAEGFSDYRD